MAPQNHLGWECCISTCLTVNKLKCEQQASLINKQSNFDTNAHAQCCKHQNSVPLPYTYTQIKLTLKQFTSNSSKKTKQQWSTPLLTF